MSNVAVLTLEDVKTLSAPFDKATISVKVQSLSKDRTKAMLVCYLQHTDVYSRLEKVDPAWSAEITNESYKGDSIFIRVRLTLRGVSRENVGEGQDAKSATSDAIKRAAMLFGVGRYLYDSETVWVPYNEQTDRFKSFTFEDYSSALRPKQAHLPTAPDPEVNKPDASNVKSIDPRKDGPKTVSPVKTRGAIGVEIMKTAHAIQLSEIEMAEWIANVFNKPMDKLTVPEMEEFLGLLKKELQGAAVK